MEKTTITRDTLLLTAVSLLLQGLSLILNLIVSKKLGTASMGVTALIFSFYSFVIVFANGNIFTSTSRFISEEIGKSTGGEGKIMQYAMTIGLILSFIVSASIFMLAPYISKSVLKNPEACFSIRIMASSLPLATLGACIKGYFHASRTVSLPCIADIIEFMTKFAVLLSLIFLFIPNRMSVFTGISISILAGEIVSSIYLSLAFLKKGPKRSAPAGTKNIKSYFVLILPIMCNGYIFAVLSSANDFLVPITLNQFSKSAEAALSQYGIFEGFVMPIMFFPSVILQSLSLILVPEIAREKSAGNQKNVRRLIEKVFYIGFSWSVFIAMLLLTFGKDLGKLFSEEEILGKSLMILCPVIPFIYLEIVLEGILKGLGKQNFCTLNSIAEYVLRISAVLIFIPLVGYWGIIVSYFVSNILCNLTRIAKVLKTTGQKFDFCRFVFIPLLSAAASGKVALLADRYIPAELSVFALFIILVIGAAVFLLSEILLAKMLKVQI